MSTRTAPPPAAWVLHPFAGAGPLRFGASRGQVRQALAEVDAVRSGGFDIWRPLGLKCGYDHEERLELITLMAPAAPSFQDRPLLGEAYSTLVAWLSPLDPAMDEGFGDAATFYTLGIMLHRALPDLDMVTEEDFRADDEPVPDLLPDRVDAVSVFARGYHDEVTRMLSHLMQWQT